MYMRWRAILTVMGAAAAALLAAAVSGAAADPPTAVTDPIKGDGVWEGRLLVERMIPVEAGATLVVRPGTEVLFSTGGGLTVHGVLRAEGTAEKPVSFLPAADGQGPWEGIVLAGGTGPSNLAFCRIRRAKVVGIAAGEHRVASCEISGGVVGISAAGDQSRPVIVGNRISDQSEAGILATANAAPVVTDNVVERCGDRGIGANQGAAPQIRGNRVSGCASGIEVSQTAPRISGNTVSGCQRGIALSSISGGEPVRGNRLERNEVGILCQQFSDPEISGNTIAGSKDGIVCFMGASPLIRNNDIVDNERGIFCNQLSNPEITANTIAGNRRGVVLHLSSYALVSGNNISGGEVLFELMNMSSDWERRAGQKPQRGLRQRNLNLVQRGRAMPEPGLAEGLDAGEGSVQASGNWWGEATTREMEEKGPSANIAALIDFHDVPTRTYEGFEGEFVQDRIVYAPWAKQRLPGTGVPPPAQPAAPAGPAP